MLCSLNEVLHPAQSGGYAVIAPEIPSLMFTEILIGRAEALSAPLILSWAPGLARGCDLVDTGRFFRIVRDLAARAQVPLVLHLDHATRLDEIRQAVDWGFTSVMIDASHLPYDENRDLTQKVVRVAHPVGVSVESELGVIGTGREDAHGISQKVQYTDPHLAEIFVRETGVDALAVAVGTVHGLYRGEPNLDFDLLATLGRRVPVPLVLHGGSGTGEDNLRRAVSLGICKINLYSELISHFHRNLKGTIDVPSVLHQQIRKAAERAIHQVLDRYVAISGSAGKSQDIIPS